MQYSRCRAEWRGRITSSDLLATLLLIQPRIGLAFWAAGAHSCIVLSSTSTNTLQVFLSKASFNLFCAQPLSIFGIALTWLQDLALDLIEIYEGFMVPCLKLVKICLDSIPSPPHVNLSTQCGVIGKLAEAALSPCLCLLWSDWCLEHLLLKPEAKNSLSTSAFSISQLPRFPIPFQSWSTFFLALVL